MVTRAVPGGIPGPDGAADARQRIAEAADRTEAAVIEVCQGPRGDFPEMVEALYEAVTALRRASEAYAALTSAACEEEWAAAAAARPSLPRRVSPRHRHLAIVPG